MTEPTRDRVSVSHRPARFSAAVAVLFAAGTVALLAPATALPALALELVGVAVAAGGAGLRRSGWHLLGTLLVAVGVLVVGGAVAVAAAELGGLADISAVVPGMVGAAAVVAAVAPVRGTGSRGLLKVGATGVLVTVLVTGLIRNATFPTLLAGTAGTVLTWDAGEQATNVGEQLGREAATVRGEAVHIVGSVLVAGAAVGLGYGLRRVSLLSVSLGSFVLLLVGALLFTAALHD